MALQSDVRGTKNDVLIIGSGGREHALGWKVSQSTKVARVYFAPGNGGTSENIGIRQSEIEKLVTFAKNKKDLLTLVGPEEPLSQGIVDEFRRNGLKIFGPTKAAARLEASKAFAKEFMRDAGIPTAPFAVFDDPEKAKDYIRTQDSPLVVKADGIAAGKGVVVCDNSGQAISAVDNMMVKRVFGRAGERLVIEKRFEGEEASFIAISDGDSIIPLASCQDHKRALDGDKGANTGGMGAYSPAAVIDEELHERIVKDVMQLATRVMKNNKTPFMGFLYAGIMVDAKTGKPYVLEFNVRMGDPECQPIMMRMESDLFDYVNAAVDGDLSSMEPIKWKGKAAVCVVMAARGYPGKYDRGKVIEGLDSCADPEVMVFHAGTFKDSQNRIVTDGGRVLGVTALGTNVREAAENAYSAVRKIRWGENSHYYRTDIAWRAINRGKS